MKISDFRNIREILTNVLADEWRKKKAAHGIGRPTSGKCEGRHTEACLRQNGSGEPKRILFFRTTTYAGDSIHKHHVHGLFRTVGNGDGIDAGLVAREISGGPVIRDIVQSVVSAEPRRTQESLVYGANAPPFSNSRHKAANTKRILAAGPLPDPFTCKGVTLHSQPVSTWKVAPKHGIANAAGGTAYAWEPYAEGGGANEIG